MFPVFPMLPCSYPHAGDARISASISSCRRASTSCLSSSMSIRGRSAVSLAARRSLYSAWRFLLPDSTSAQKSRQDASVAEQGARSEMAAASATSHTASIFATTLLSSPGIRSRSYQRRLLRNSVSFEPLKKSPHPSAPRARQGEFCSLSAHIRPPTNPPGGGPEQHSLRLALCLSVSLAPSLVLSLSLSLCVCVCARAHTHARTRACAGSPAARTGTRAFLFLRKSAKCTFDTCRFDRSNSTEEPENQ